MQQRIRNIKEYHIRTTLGRLLFKTVDIEEARARILGSDNIIHYVFDKKKQSV